jgi:hypothetical protein
VKPLRANYSIKEHATSHRAPSRNSVHRHGRSSSPTSVDFHHHDLSLVTHAALWEHNQVPTLTSMDPTAGATALITLLPTGNDRSATDKNSRSVSIEVSTADKTPIEVDQLTKHAYVATIHTFAETEVDHNTQVDTMSPQSKPTTPAAKKAQKRSANSTTKLRKKDKKTKTKQKSHVEALNPKADAMYQPTGEGMVLALSQNGTMIEKYTHTVLTTVNYVKSMNTLFVGNGRGGLGIKAPPKGSKRITSIILSNNYSVPFNESKNVYGHSLMARVLKHNSNNPKSTPAQSCYSVIRTEMARLNQLWNKENQAIADRPVKALYKLFLGFNSFHYDQNYNVMAIATHFLSMRVANDIAEEDGDYKMSGLHMIDQIKYAATYWYTNLQPDNTEGHLEDNDAFFSMVIALVNGHLIHNEIPAINWNPVITIDTNQCAPLRNSHEIKKGHGTSAYFVEKDTDLRTKYAKHLAIWKEYCETRSDSDSEEDSEDED